MSIQYLKGDATAPAAEGPTIIAHVCNDRGGWGRGFVLAISARWPEPEASYRSWHKGGVDAGFRLGAVQLVQIAESAWVANMVAQAGTRVTKHGPPIRYPALRECLRQLAAEAKNVNASVHMPRLGCGLAGGKWEEVARLGGRRGLRV